MEPGTSRSLSVVVPLLNEAESLRPLYDRLIDSLVEVGELYEVIFVDDGFWKICTEMTWNTCG
jgi:hypothetical protein